MITTTVKTAEEDINALVQEGWQVISTNVMSGTSFTVASAPMIVTLGRKA